MKRSAKVALIVAACLIVIGALAAAAAIMLTHGQWEKLSYSVSTAYTERTEAFNAADVEHLHIIAEADDVKFMLTDGTEYRVTCWENDSNTYDITLSGGTLSVKYTPGSRFWNIGIGPGPLLVEVPRECARASIESVSGDVRLPDGLSLGGTLAVCTVSGEVRIGEICVEGDAEVCSTSGEISMRGASVSGRIAAATVSGSFDLTDTSSSGDASFSTTSGEVCASGFACGKLDISSISGDVIISKLDCAGAEIDTTSGEVVISLTEPSGFRYECKSVSGDVRLPKASGDSSSRFFKVDTVSGEIKIS